jgi:hypothetical protein
VLSEQWPGLAMVEGQRVRGVAGAQTAGTHTLAVDCEDGLHVVDVGSIIVDPDEPYQLQAVGGVPPYVWSLSRARSDMSLSADGIVDILRYQWWAYLSDVVVTDSAGASAGSDAYLVAPEDGCVSVPEIACGERVLWDGANEEYPWVCLQPERAGVLRTSAHPLADMKVTGAARIPANGREYLPRYESAEAGWEVPISERLIGTAVIAELEMFTTGWRGNSGWFEFVCDE